MNGSPCPSCGHAGRNAVVCGQCGVLIPLERFAASLKTRLADPASAFNGFIMTPERLLWLAALVPLLVVPPVAVVLLVVFARGSRRVVTSHPAMALITFVAVANIVLSIAFWRHHAPTLADLATRGWWSAPSPPPGSLNV